MASPAKEFFIFNVVMSVQKTFIIKPTMNCNLRCKYCYEFNKNGDQYAKNSLSIDDLQGVIARTARLFPNSRVLWLLHGGEPLLTGYSYVKKFISSIRQAREQCGVDYQFALQTNATLITPDIVSLLEDNKDLLSGRVVSISIDGPKALNDQVRVSKSGKSSYAATIRGLELIKNSTVDFSTISVIGAHNVDSPDDVFFFTKSLGSNLCKLIPCYNFDEYGVCEKAGVTPTQYAAFMCRIFDLWMHDMNSKSSSRDIMLIDPIVTILAKLSKSFVTWCEYRDEKCDNFICLYPDGELWLCDSMNHDTMRSVGFIGNIHDLSDEDYAKAISSPCRVCQFQDFYAKVTEACRSCEILDLCRGGCLPMRNNLYGKSSFLSEDYCNGRKMLISHIKKAFDSAMS